MPEKNDQEITPEEIEARKKIWRDELEQSAWFRELAAPFNAATTNIWLEYYVSVKYLWLKWLEGNEQYHEDERLTWMNLANLHLEVILQKKLFDAQCLWRAEQIKFAGVEICYDFEVWEGDILNCPFIEPITGHDIDLYLQYLQHPDAEPDQFRFKGNLVKWQDYYSVQDLLEEPEGDLCLPPWYQYHNQFTGQLLHSLPDSRGIKEEYYRDQTYDARQKEQDAAEAAGGTPPDHRPPLFFDNQAFMNHVLAHEPARVKRANELYNWSQQHFDDEQHITSMTGELLRAEIPVPVAAHANWYEALKEASRRYRCGMIAGALPQAFEQYQMTIQMGIGFPRNEAAYGKALQFRPSLMETLLAGRRLLGEPENLDF